MGSCVFLSNFSLFKIVRFRIWNPQPFLFEASDSFSSVTSTPVGSGPCPGGFRLTTTTTTGVSQRSGKPRLAAAVHVAGPVCASWPGRSLWTEIVCQRETTRRIRVKLSGTCPHTSSNNTPLSAFGFLPTRLVSRTSDSQPLNLRPQQNGYLWDFFFWFTTLECTFSTYTSQGMCIFIEEKRPINVKHSYGFFFYFSLFAKNLVLILLNKLKKQRPVFYTVFIR